MKPYADLYDDLQAALLQIITLQDENRALRIEVEELCGEIQMLKELDEE